jgi:hypothetical protein
MEPKFKVNDKFRLKEDHTFAPTFRIGDVGEGEKKYMKAGNTASISEVYRTIKGSAETSYQNSLRRFQDPFSEGSEAAGAIRPGLKQKGRPESGLGCEPDECVSVFFARAVTSLAASRTAGASHRTRSGGVLELPHDTVVGANCLHAHSVGRQRPLRLVCG